MNWEQAASFRSGGPPGSQLMSEDAKLSAWMSPIRRTTSMSADDLIAPSSSASAAGGGGRQGGAGRGGGAAGGGRGGAGGKGKDDLEEDLLDEEEEGAYDVRLPIPRFLHLISFTILTLLLWESVCHVTSTTTCERAHL